MEESPPPVPPKDAKYQPRMEVERPNTATTSGSKRKRQSHDEIYHEYDSSNHETDDPERPTPSKRTRSSLTREHAQGSTSEDATPGHPRNVRRKKGSRNLSNLNLRHAAQKQATNLTLSRESKFQEGSLTDKPSDKPPSIFTRAARSVSRDVDQLMQEYHDGVESDQHADADGQKSSTGMHEATNTSKKDDGPGIFQFGRQWAASFLPGGFLRKIWADSKDDAGQQHMQEVGKKAQQRVEAEARYAEMKKSGQLGLRPVSSLGIPMGTGLHTPRDSGVEMDGLEQSRSISQASESLHLPESENDIQDTTTKQIKGQKPRMHIKKPSLTNIRSGLKRMGSDLNLAATLRGRESSSSLSPVKTDFDNSILRRSESRYDLKKQQKLSKRVSDLEAKLAHARQELNEAFVEASPAPKLTGKYERFTPSATIRRSKFIPGKLPSLPSERVLMADQALAESQNTREMGEREPRKALDFSEVADEDEDEEGTIRATRATIYPRRASSLFNLDNVDINNQVSEVDLRNPGSNITSTEGGEIENMDPNSIVNSTSETPVEPKKSTDYASLDQKLKALDANVKLAKKAAKPKKRKSAAADSDKAYKPGQAESDDVSDWDGAKQTPKKKRKSVNSGSPKRSSPKGKKTRGNEADNATSSPPKVRAKTASKPANKVDDDITMTTEQGDISLNEGGMDDDLPRRASMESEAQPLDVVYEEEEDTTKVPLNDEPTKPTAKATPAHFGRSGLRSRSHSPHKRSRSAMPGAEEQMLTRAAAAVKSHPARRAGRSPSPPAVDARVSVNEDEEVVAVTPGTNGVPKLPRGATGSFESLVDVAEGDDEVEETIIVGTGVVTRRAASFEWPEDVF